MVVATPNNTTRRRATRRVVVPLLLVVLVAMVMLLQLPLTSSFVITGRQAPPFSSSLFPTQSPSTSSRRRGLSRRFGEDKKWSNDQVNDFEQRIESVKVAVISGLAGSVASVPVGLITDVLIGGSFPQWEFNTDTLALESALFGIVYRYAVRQDQNPQLKDGVVGAFALTRALAMVRTSPMCLAVPLRCGPPLGYFDWSMLLSVSVGLATSFVAFGVASRAIEAAFGKGWIKRFP